MENTQPSLDGLAATITEDCRILTSYMRKNKIPEPTFASNSPQPYRDLPTDINAARQRLAATAVDLWQLALGPEDMVWDRSWTLTADAAILDSLNKFDFWSAVPIDGSASYADISECTQLPESVVRRILRYAFTMRLFVETDTGRVGHTASSAHLAQSWGSRAMIWNGFGEVAWAKAALPEVLRLYARGKSSPPQTIKESGWAIVNKSEETGESIGTFEFISSDSKWGVKGYRQKLFEQSMQYMTEYLSVEKWLAKAFDWASLGEVVVVDVGGNSGRDAVKLAESFPNLKFIVQDLPSLKPVFQGTVPSELRGRISFMPFNFMEESQQVRTADIYMAKSVLHDWSDSDAIKILRHMVPAMRTGSRILLVELVLLPYGQLPWAMDRFASAVDIGVFSAFNGRERTLQDWRDVITGADARFELHKIHSLPENPYSVLEVVWNV